MIPSYSVADLHSLQEVDPLLKALQPFLRLKATSTWAKRQQLPREALTLLCQLDCLVKKDGVLFRRVFRSDGGEKCLQLILPAALKQETLK